ncbi:MAG TPA: CbbQ/NirQ/NorQ/GpvN family protein [Clostridiaceae bacterium]|nr:CbbQ/NirQ/NorQ/GpvN family protein [Clostridiaceae bacterium]
MKNEKNTVINEYRIKEKPNYISQDNEEEIFLSAWRQRIPLIIKGPTGCGKTRFLQHMAYKLNQPLITVSCHEDLTSSDLVGRYLLKGEETVWQDGPLTLAVRHGGICYLDEIVEARNDTTVLIHSLTDDRRILYLDRTGEVLKAHPDFMLVLSFNPGDQSIRKNLKESTKQRFSSIIFNHPSVEVEKKIIESETRLPEEMCETLAMLGEKIRNLQGYGLIEGASTRLLVYAGRLIKGGLSPWLALKTAVTRTLTDDPEVMNSIEDIIRMFFEEEKLQ